jgi:AraC family transcriptional regulator
MRQAEEARFTQQAKFDAFLRGPTWLRMSSQGLNWNGFAIEHLILDPRELPEAISDHYIVGLWGGQPAVGEHPNARGRFSPYTKYPGALSFVPPGTVPAVRSNNRFEITLFAIEATLVNRVEAELDEQPLGKLPYQSGFYDPILQQLLTLLAREAEQGGPSGKMYAEHLAHALTLRFLLMGSSVRRRILRTSPLPHHLLNRVLGRMRDELSAELDMETLAAETGYSRRHFLRMFQTSTGETPHRYLLRLRLDRARELIQKGHSPLIDIAASSGFGSHSHMTKVFRQMLGVTPSEYRRRL